MLVDYRCSSNKYQYVNVDLFFIIRMLVNKTRENLLLHSLYFQSFSSFKWFKFPLRVLLIQPTHFECWHQIDWSGHSLIIKIIYDINVMHPILKRHGSLPPAHAPFLMSFEVGQRGKRVKERILPASPRQHRLLWALWDQDLSVPGFMTHSERTQS